MMQSRHCVIVKILGDHLGDQLFFVIISEFFDGLLNDASLGNF